MVDTYKDIDGLPNDYIWQKEFIEGFMIEKFSKTMEWLDFIPKVETDAESIVGYREQYSADTDPKKRLPRKRTSGAEFVVVTASDLQEISAIVAQAGWSVVFTERARRFARTDRDMVRRRLMRIINWMGEYMNREIISALTNATKGVDREASGMKFYDRTVAKWSAETANPVDDMILMSQDMEDHAPGYRATDFFVHKDNFAEMLRHLINLDVDRPTREALFGMPQAQMDSIYIPVLGATIHKVQYGLTEGDIMAMDRSITPATMYYTYNPEYAPKEFVPMENNQTLDNNFGLHSHRYLEDKTHELNIQLWLENTIMVKDATAGLFMPTGSYGI